MMRRRLLSGAGVLALAGLFPLSALSAKSVAPPMPLAHAAQRCATLSKRVRWAEPDTRITDAVARPAGFTLVAPPQAQRPFPPIALPAHCELIGVMHERTGVDGQRYAIRFHLRLPETWNGRFFFQGGGGTNGDLGDAIGRLGGGAAPALVQGFAVLSQDSGHDNALNTVPGRGGQSAFGFDPQARADYGGASLKPAVEAALSTIKAYYGRGPRFSYFVGCSKGGQEGMMLAQRYPDLFDGIVAAAPGFSLPRAAVAEAWDTRSFAAVVLADHAKLTPASFASGFSDADLGLVGKTILKACDAADGAVDGMIGAFAACTSDTVLPELRRITCRSGKTADCLSPAQIAALVRTHDGPRDATGKPLYAGFPWDAGWADIGWRMWKTGSTDGRMPSINVAMGLPSLAAVFSTPPTALPADPQAALDFAMRYDFGDDAARIYATVAPFKRSAWQDIGARSSDLSAFRARGGRMIVPQGVSDPVFSINDTIAWLRDVDQRWQGHASEFVRLFPVPGMTHCGGGPATDDFDAFASLVQWVEHQAAPERILATAGPRSAWPGRTRPLCPYPRVARYNGSGDIERAGTFTCT
jgi:hypothetical protein